MKDFPKNKSKRYNLFEKNIVEVLAVIKMQLSFSLFMLLIQVYLILVSLLNFQVRLGEGNSFAGNIVL